MKLSTKLFKYDFNPDTGISTVILKSKRGLFTGTAKVHSEDKEVQSKFFGLNTAEKKALQKLYKEELKREKIILETIKRVQKDLQENLHDTGSYDDYVILSTLRKRLHFIERNHSNNITILKDSLEGLKKSLAKDKEYLKKIKEKKRSKE